jgi:uncharacterized membrane protein
LIFIGFGGFNIIEGIINHHILEMHHVIDVPDPFVFDVTFLVVGGLAFLIIGGTLIGLGINVILKVRISISLIMLLK